MVKNIIVDDLSKLRIICGANDRNISYIEILMGIEILTKGNTLFVEDEDVTKLALFEALVKKLEMLIINENQVISESEIFMEYQSIINSPELIDSLSEVNLFEDYNVISVNNKTIFAKSFNQSRFIKMMNDNQITFAIGPAGTGKTFLAIAFALSQITSGEKQKIILTRPVVEAGENLGFLPGTLSEKLSPYVRPLYDAMEWMLPPSIINKLEANGAIEVAPLAYMRGRSLHNSIIILDEAQNTTIEQMKMFLTRIGENSKSIITGDITQIDLPRGHRSGLVHANDILRDINGMDFVEFTSKDVVRAKIVQKIIDAYAKDYSNGQ
ncbi:MAG: PhoH family protein [Sphaerochaetaceae bacterium]|nr:PhoH family protein [Sphaerochaetaceae bacterium]MDC7237924.1 PhoH family protein [Sphaerochaetaceae bacterium]MDC7249619.1 PhoH family protein [Sphaerochaetaceae bacterium]